MFSKEMLPRKRPACTPPRVRSSISEGDFNPEKIQIDFGNSFSPMLPQLSIGDRLSDVTGVLNYAFNNYEVLITEPVTVTTDSGFNLLSCSNRPPSVAATTCVMP